MTTTAWNETDRLAALHAYDILDSEREPAFDDVTALLARVCDAPIAVINLVDAERQWFKSEVGLGVSETPLETSFCRHLLQADGALIVPDATADPRFACYPQVAEGGIRFYAGVPLLTEDGLPLGALCVLDTRPRPEGLDDLQSQTIEVLARQVMNLLTLRRALRDARESDAELAGAGQALAESDAKFRVLADSMPQMVWSTLPDGFHDYYNARWYEFTGVPPGSTDGAGWNDMFHPADPDRGRTPLGTSLKAGPPQWSQNPARGPGPPYRWTLGRASPIRNEQGEITRWFGTCTDIEDLKRVVDSKDLLSQELSHRIKNIFAVVSALIALSARQFPEAKEFAAAVRTRINALARAHEFVRPHTDTSRPTVGTMTLHAFLNDLFKPYARLDGRMRVVVTGDDAVFDDQAATSVALLFHELATNTAKYGALSAEGGTVPLATRHEGGPFNLVWNGHGGPPLAGEPKRVGFGSSLATLSVETQLGGRLQRLWAPEGLQVTADLPATALSRRRAAQIVA